MRFLKIILSSFLSFLPFTPNYLIISVLDALHRKVIASYKHAINLTFYS